MEKKLPVILRREEVKLLLEGPKNLGHRTILTTMYAAGLRVSEVVNLKAADIASDAVAEVAGTSECVLSLEVAQGLAVPRRHRRSIAH